MRFNKWFEGGERISGVDLWDTGESLGVECAINNIVEEAGVVSLWKSRGLKSNIVVVLEDFVTSFEREVVSILQCLEVEV